MSICRWSSNDFHCDIYAYEDVSGGITVHVAGNRVIFADPLPEPVPFTPENIELWFARHHQVTAMVDTAKREPIGLSRDGQTFRCLAPDDALELIESLRAEGYVVPDYAMDEVREIADGEPAP